MTRETCHRCRCQGCDQVTHLEKAGPRHEGLQRGVDTAYRAALRLRRDANHDAAVRLWSPGLALLTTHHVVGETWTFLRPRNGHPPAVAFLDAVEAAVWLTVVNVDEGIERCRG